MSREERYEDSAPPSPYWERKSLLKTLTDMPAKRLGEAALHMTSQLNALVVWAGRTASFEAEEGPSETSLIVQVRSSVMQTEVWVALDDEPVARHYSLSPPGPFEDLDQVTRADDKALGYALQHAVFEPAESEAAIERMIRWEHSAGSGRW